jgi:hypothetical protein
LVKSQSEGLAIRFSAIGANAIGGTYPDMKSVEAAIGQSIIEAKNQAQFDQLAWKVFGENMNASFKVLQGTGRLSTAKDYGYALLEISKGLHNAQ